jgi:hypothetical protein
MSVLGLFSRSRDISTFYNGHLFWTELPRFSGQQKTAISAYRSDFMMTFSAKKISPLDGGFTNSLTH